MSDSCRKMRYSEFLEEGNTARQEENKTTRAVSADIRKVVIVCGEKIELPWPR